MGNFFKYTFASILGTILTFVIIFFIFIGIIAVSTQPEPVVIKDNSIIKFDLTKIIQERQPVNPFAQFNFGEDDVIQGLNEIKKSLKAAKSDDKINGIYIDAGIFVGGGLATLEEVRDALIDFKSSGKYIIAYGENFNQKSYYVASIADKIYLNPMGIVDFKGLNAQVSFFKNALEKLEVDVQIIRGPGNKFKSAVEPFMYDKMSEANKEQTSIFLGSIWNNLLSNISKSRNISTENLQTIADELTAYDSKGALSSGLVDGLKYWDEVENELKSLNKTKDAKKLNFITLAKYNKTVKPENRKEENKIAIIYANGEIQGGKGNDEIIGSDRIAEAIRTARQDSSIKAIVFRINSPGGSAQASEIIYRELILTKGVKPIVVSMGDYAASGGYYIACMADKIYAQPNTLTGSIGVFGMVPNIQKLVNNKLGITFDGVKTAENADVYTLTQPLTSYQTEVIRNMINNIYSTFIQHVADGRNMTTVEVDSIGQGRVWSGTDAIKIGLVDELGGIDSAVAFAAKLANLTSYKMKELPALENPFEDLINKLNDQTKIESVLTAKMGIYGEYFNFFSNLDKKDNIQARLPYFISIE